MRRRDLFKFATGSVAAFLVGQYGAPQPETLIVVRSLWGTLSQQVLGEAPKAAWVAMRMSQDEGRMVWAR